MSGYTMDDLYNNFKETLHECSSELLGLSDDMFGYVVFEELPIDMVSFVYKDTLKKFYEEGLIDDPIMEKSLELREYYESVEQGFRLETVKDSPELKHIMELSDEIIKLLYL